MRYIVVISMLLVLVGVVFVAGSLFMVPYTVREPTRVDRSKVWADDAFVLSPFTNRTFVLDSLAENASIFQIDVNSSDFVILKIVRFPMGEVWFERTMKSRTSYWTLPFQYGIWNFVFVNPSSASIDAAVKITEFYVKIIEYQNVTHYRSLLDPVYGYLGIAAIIVETALNLIQASRDAKRRSQQPDQEAPPL